MDYRNLIINEAQKLNNFDNTSFNNLIKNYNWQSDENKSNFLKYLIYKNSDKVESLKHLEADCSKEITESYLVTYKYLNNYKISKDNFNKYYLSGELYLKGDVLTSVQTPMKNFLFLYDINYSNYGGYILGNLKKIEKVPNYFFEFLDVAYTIGNFMPVPKNGFNAFRSNYGEWDSWDLALQQIYKWYEDNKDKKNVNDNRSIIKLFSNKSNKSKNIDYADAVSTTAKWLSSFECWENFISMNYLEPFVTKELEPKMFFANHSLDYPIPKNKKEFKSFFINVTRAIKKRNKLIYNNIKNTSEYKKIKEITKLQENYVNLKGYKNRTKLREIFMDSISPRQVRDRLKRFKNNKLENSSVFVSWLGSIISVIFGFVIFISSIFSGLYNNINFNINEINFTSRLNMTYYNSRIFVLLSFGLFLSFILLTEKVNRSSIANIFFKIISRTFIASMFISIIYIFILKYNISYITSMLLIGPQRGIDWEMVGLFSPFIINFILFTIIIITLFIYKKFKYEIKNWVFSLLMIMLVTPTLLFSLENINSILILISVVAVIYILIKILFNSKETLTTRKIRRMKNIKTGQIEEYEIEDYMDDY